MWYLSSARVASMISHIQPFHLLSSTTTVLCRSSGQNKIITLLLRETCLDTFTFQIITVRSLLRSVSIHCGVCLCRFSYFLHLISRALLILLSVVLSPHSNEATSSVTSLFTLELSIALSPTLSFMTGALLLISLTHPALILQLVPYY